MGDGDKDDVRGEHSKGWRVRRDVLRERKGYEDILNVGKCVVRR